MKKLSICIFILKTLAPKNMAEKKDNETFKLKIKNVFFSTLKFKGLLRAALLRQ